MSKRPFDHIENRFREAAENSEPPFNEHAWEKMELLLEKERRKKRFFFWWVTGLPILIACLVVGGYAWYSSPSGAGKPHAQADSIIATETQKAAGPITADDTTAAIIKVPGNNVEANQNTATLENNDKAVSTSTASGDRTQQHTETLSSRRKVVKTSQKAAQEYAVTEKDLQSTSALKHSKKNKASANGNATVTTSMEVSVEDVQEVPTKSQQADAIHGSANVRDIKNVDARTGSPVVAGIQNKEAPDSSKTQPITSIKKPGKSVNPGTSRFYFVVEGGAEISKTRLFSYNNSKISGRYGVVIGYELSKRMSIQTGFFAGRKKYIGGPGDYHPKLGTYLSTVDIKQVDASCMIYDLPVAIRYNLDTKGNTRWFVTGGVSSFIMKKEDYNYYYTYYNTPYTLHEKPYSYTGNKNLFSILTLSAGLERPLLKHTSLLIEPFLSLPLKGVGEGTVKLYSTGLQVGIKYKPKF